MDRKDFLSLLGYSAASVTLASCLGACSKNSGSTSTAPTSLDFTLDLTSSSNSALLTNGGYLYSNGVIVARTTADTYIAVQQLCTHQTVPVVYEGANHRFYCNGHGATFSETGSVLGGPAPASLRTYNTSLTGNMLRVYA